MLAVNMHLSPNMLSICLRARPFSHVVRREGALSSCHAPTRPRAITLLSLLALVLKRGARGVHQHDACLALCGSSWRGACPRACARVHVVALCVAIGVRRCSLVSPKLSWSVACLYV